MMKHRLSLEKNHDASEIYLHGSPESLRILAKKLWAIAEAAENQGQHSEQLSTSGADAELTSHLQGDAADFSLLHHLVISARTD